MYFLLQIKLLDQVGNLSHHLHPVYLLLSNLFSYIYTNTHDLFVIRICPATKLIFETSRPLSVVCDPVGQHYCLREQLRSFVSQFLQDQMTNLKLIVSTQSSLSRCFPNKMYSPHVTHSLIRSSTPTLRTLLTGADSNLSLFDFVL